MTTKTTKANTNSSEINEKGGNLMKVGNIIHRKDMPNIYYRIVGQSSASEWHNMWVVRLISSKRELSLSTGLVSMDDDRWVVWKESNKSDVASIVALAPEVGKLPQKSPLGGA